MPSGSTNVKRFAATDRDGGKHDSIDFTRRLGPKMPRDCRPDDRLGRAFQHATDHLVGNLSACLLYTSDAADELT